MEWTRRRRRLDVALGITRIELLCAPSVWASLLTRCARRYGTVHFADGMQRLAGAGLVRVELSGLQLAELMDVAARRGRWWSREDPPGRALCRTVYQAVAASIDQLGPDCAESAIAPITLTTGTSP
ncbi:MULTISPECIES: hypothetical protein [unclassified Streptomyces]|uniref:hypothetical protein n=1 Tax=unclassified Streptomyces TaxID=2593676 RepID=UPI0033F07759